jgi:hypothetical protein
VGAFARVRDLQFEAVPYSLDSHEGLAYLLLVASINQGTSAEHVRALVRALYDFLGGDLLRLHEVPAERYQEVLGRFRLPSWRVWGEVPAILASAARFVETARLHGGLVARGRAQRSVADAAEWISRNIYYMGRDPAGARKKTWMFLRWAVRPAPDLGVWSPPLSPADLRVPLDVNTGSGFADLVGSPALRGRAEAEGVRLALDGDGRVASTAANVEAVTAAARWFFPEDPARVDYAFFAYGRRNGRGHDGHRCWRFVDCCSCPLRDVVACPGVVPVRAPAARLLE